MAWPAFTATAYSRDANNRESWRTRRKGPDAHPFGMIPEPSDAFRPTVDRTATTGTPWCCTRLPLCWNARKAKKERPEVRARLVGSIGGTVRWGILARSPANGTRWVAGDWQAGSPCGHLDHHPTTGRRPAPMATRKEIELAGMADLPHNQGIWEAFNSSPASPSRSWPHPP
jgi:hypothetical protein